MNKLALILILALAAPAMAQTSANPKPGRTLEALQTSQTQHLLELQRSGRHASRQEQRLDGQAQQKIYERYINSFGHPIPERYSSESFSE